MTAALLPVSSTVLLRVNGNGTVHTVLVCSQQWLQWLQSSPAGEATGVASCFVNGPSGCGAVANPIARAVPPLAFRSAA
jgi:hypothetical protein